MADDVTAEPEPEGCEIPDGVVANDPDDTSGSPDDDETSEVAFTVEVVLLLPTGREPPLPRPAVDVRLLD